MSEEDKGLSAAVQAEKPRCCQTYGSWASVMEGLRNFYFWETGIRFESGKVRRDDNGTKNKDKKSINGRNDGSDVTKGWAKLFMGTGRLASMPE